MNSNIGDSGLIAESLLSQLVSTYACSDKRGGKSSHRWETGTVFDCVYIIKKSGTRDGI